MPPLMSFTKTWAAFAAGSKSVTRRSRRLSVIREDRSVLVWKPGWTSLKVGDVIEGIEWMPRWRPHGERWVCRDCDWLGPTDPCMTAEAKTDRWCAHAKARPLCDRGTRSLEWRAPERLPGTDGHRRIVSTREEKLGDITPDEIVLEGFPSCSVGWFVDMYCSYDPDWERPVNRIEFEELS